jgi:gentisate 1,2-dioxygenase
VSSEPNASPAVETPERRAFYDRISRQNLTPLWVSLANLVTPEPVSPCQPAVWRFADLRAAMMEAGGLITAKEAERRVLVLENPGLRGQSKRRTGAWDPCHGIKMRYVNPLTGGYTMTTIGAFIQLLPRRFSTAPYRSTDAHRVRGDERTRMHAHQ